MHQTRNGHTVTEKYNHQGSEANSNEHSSLETALKQKKSFFNSSKMIQHNDHVEHLLGLFAGDDGREYYLKKWAQARPTWNWAAFFFSLWWLGYRRMYIPLITILGGFLFLHIVTALFNLDFSKIDGLLRLAVMISLGISGNSIYRQHAIKTINKYKNKYEHQETLEERIASKGGISFESFMISNVILIVYIIILGLL